MNKIWMMEMIFGRWYRLALSKFRLLQPERVLMKTKMHMKETWDFLMIPKKKIVLRKMKKRILHFF